MKNIPQAYRPSYLWFWPPLILGGFSNFCRYYTRSQVGKSTGYRPTLKPLYLNLHRKSRRQKPISVVDQEINCDIGDRQRNPWTGIDTNVVGLNRLMESQLFSLHNWISNNNTDINKQQQKTAQLKHSNIFVENVNVQNLIQEIDKGCSRIKYVKTYIFHPHHPPKKIVKDLHHQ
jgi:hypothetical protein